MALWLKVLIAIGSALIAVITGHYNDSKDDSDLAGKK